jgi:hypothetical protein
MKGATGRRLTQISHPGNAKGVKAFSPGLHALFAGYPGSPSHPDSNAIGVVAILSRRDEQD